MKRYYIVYEGIVQGVGFRWKIMTLARKYNLTGYVRNLDNGNVEAEVQGNGVDEFLKESLSKDRFIRIYDYSVKEIPLSENERIFDVRF
jgi:acylphosphatase